MSSTPKTIQIFLPGGDPRGIRVAELTTRIVQAIEVPRSLLSEFETMPESRQVAVYFLFGGDEEDAQVYIGQTGDLKGRLDAHNRHKEFWERALVIVSKTNSLTQTHALYLEWLCIQKTREVGRFTDHNGTAGSRPHTPAPLEADCHEIFDTGKTLLATLGFPIFTPLREVASDEEQTIYYCTASGTNAKGIYTTDGFVVLAGSVGRMKNVSSMGTSDKRLRRKLLRDGVVSQDGETITFAKDQLFGSPSKAALAVTGGSYNGWTTWKTEDGLTLDEVERSEIVDDRTDA